MKFSTFLRCEKKNFFTSPKPRRSKRRSNRSFFPHLFRTTVVVMVMLYFLGWTVYAFRSYNELTDRSKLRTSGLSPRFFPGEKTTCISKRIFYDTLRSGLNRFHSFSMWPQREISWRKGRRRHRRCARKKKTPSRTQDRGSSFLFLVGHLRRRQKKGRFGCCIICRRMHVLPCGELWPVTCHRFPSFFSQIRGGWRCSEKSHDSHTQRIYIPFFTDGVNRC